MTCSSRLSLSFGSEPIRPINSYTVYTKGCPRRSVLKVLVSPSTERYSMYKVTPPATSPIRQLADFVRDPECDFFAYDEEGPHAICIGGRPRTCTVR